MKNFKNLFLKSKKEESEEARNNTRGIIVRQR